jgi:hypothetical protein
MELDRDCEIVVKDWIEEKILVFELYSSKEQIGVEE